MENKKRYSLDELLKETDNLIKKYKVDVKTTIDNHSKTEHHEIDITEKELDKFLFIFNYYLKQMKKKDSGEATDAEDGIPDILMLITTKLLELLQQNIDSLNIPNILKKAFKKLKELIFKQKNAVKEIHSSSQETLFVESKPSESSSSSQSTSSDSSSSSSSSSSSCYTCSKRKDRCCRWGSQGAESSAMVLWQSLCGGSGNKVHESFWPFYIWRTNK